MGLVIHWTWKTDFSRDDARRITQRLFEYASTLGFKHCFEPVEIDWSREPADENEIFLRMRSQWTTHHEYEVNGIRESTGDLIEPTWSICFFATDPGAEPAFFGFGDYPTAWKHRGEDLPTEARGLSWMNFAKTQYASLPDDGGEPNFMAAHLRIIKVLDEAVRLGVPLEVVDDGEFWTTRDENHLLAKLRQYNGLIAAFAGHMKDTLGSDAIEAPIRGHQHFESLEARGNAEFGHKFNEAQDAVRDMLKRAEDE
ncbi:MAG: hypothetical protein IPK87_02410 [Planctomycetes bacterium]|nr:hypothetical protein [Planctomycetota bacterium]